MANRALDDVEEEFDSEVAVAALPRESARDAASWLLLAVAVAAFILLYFRFGSAPAPAPFVARPASLAIATTDAKPAYREAFVSTGVTRSTHSATGLQDNEGNIRAFWFGGTREGARDTAIYASVHTPAGWTPEQIVVKREVVQQQLGRYIAKLGNPVAMRDSAGRLWLYFVSVSVGGWSGSAVNAVMSADNGKTWGPARRLVTSPFVNISTLVKGAPIFFGDGTVGLPVYHEIFGKFGELLRLDNEGNVIDKTRLSWGRHSLQPVIVPSSASEALGFMRYAGPAPGRVLMFRSVGGGEAWDEPRKIDLPNPNAAVAALGLEGGGVLLAFNNSDDSRDVLALAHSGDGGKSWRVIHTVERPKPGPEKEYSYPWLMRGDDGQFHLFYTWSRTHIKHVSFNPAWLKQKL